MLAGVVDTHLTIGFDRQPPDRGEKRIAHIVLGADGGRCSQLLGPPEIAGIRREQALAPIGRRSQRRQGREAKRHPTAAAHLQLLPATANLHQLPAAARLQLLAAAALVLGLKAAAGEKIGLVGELGGDRMAEPVDACLEGMVEHVAQHQHAAAHPLP